MPDEVRVTLAEGLVVGPEDVLIVKLNLDHVDDEVAYNTLSAVAQELETLGLRGRSLVVTGREASFFKVARSAVADA